MRTRTARLVVALATGVAGATLAGWIAIRAQTEPVVFGAFVQPAGGQSARQAVEGLEQAIGRQLGGVRVYKRWDSPFPTDDDRWLRDSGRTPFLSVAPQRMNGQLIPFRAIADAPVGSDLYLELVRWAHRVRDFGGTIYFTFDHEPEGDDPSVVGTREDFIDAWRRVVDVFRENGAGNVRFTWILTAYTFGRTDANGASSWYPGDDYVDAIGADDYNWFGCQPGVSTQWRSFAEVFDPVRAFGAEHPDKEVVIGEWGAVEDPAVPGRKADWIREATATLTSPGWEQVTAVLYWDSSGHVGSPPCQFWVDSSQSSLEAFAAMGADPHFFLAAPPQVSALSPGTGPVGTAVTVTGLNFSGVQRVAFGATAAPFVVQGLSSITTSVPPGASAGPVAVTTSYGEASGPLFSVAHPRSVSFELAGRRASGRLEVGDGFGPCATEETLRIQRWVPGGGWRTVFRASTHAGGAFRTHLPDRPGRYRAHARRHVLSSGDICEKADSRRVRQS